MKLVTETGEGREKLVLLAIKEKIKETQVDRRSAARSGLLVAGGRLEQCGVHVHAAHSLAI